MVKRWLSHGYLTVNHGLTIGVMKHLYQLRAIIDGLLMVFYSPRVYEDHQGWLKMTISHLWISKLSMIANDGYFTFLDLKTINDG